MSYTWIAIAALAGTLSAPGTLEEATSQYASILKTYVSEGRVNYQGLKSKGKAELDSYLASIRDAKLPEGREAQAGHLIDAYNALVLKSVLDTGIPKSVLEVKGFFDSRSHQVFGRKVTLDQLEKEWLNPLAKDSRTHFVLVCGAKGCPILESKPYAGTELAERFSAATKRYLASSAGSAVGATGPKVSKIFEWYAKDFGGSEGVRTFLSKWGPTALKKSLKDKKVLGYLEYDWALNR